MDMFYALAEPNRRNIIEMLARQGELSATSIAEKFHITPAAVSQHLKVLREAKLIRMEKRAQQRIYTLNPQAIEELERWAQQMSESFDALGDMLDGEGK
jgi:DNA-binding transcriptional ArsR family regulator